MPRAGMPRRGRAAEQAPPPAPAANGGSEPAAANGGSEPDAAAPALIGHLFAEAPIGLGIWDRDLRYLLVNQRLAEMNGVPVAEHIGRSVADVLPDLAPKLEPTLRGVAERGEAVIDLEISGETPAEPGRRRTWLASYYPLSGAAGEVLGVGAVVVEVSGQRSAEQERALLVEQLAAERARLEEVVRRMPLGVAIAEAPSGRLVLGNEQLEAIFRHPFRASAGFEAYDEWRIFHPSGPPIRAEEWPLARSIATGEIVTDEELDIERGDGSRGTISVSSAPLHGRGGEVVAAVATVLDITGRRRAAAERERLLEREHAERIRAETGEQRLAAQLGFTKAITDHLGEAVLATDERSRISFVNPAAEEVLGWTAAELQGRDMHETLHHTRPDGSPYPRDECPLLRVLDEGVSLRATLDHLVRRDGTLVPVAYSSSPIVVGGRVTGMVVNFNDVSERERAERERSRLLELEHDARLRAERAERRARFLAETGALLGASLDYETTLANVSRAAVGEVADWAVIDLLQGTIVQRVVSAHVDPTKAELPLEIARRYPTDPDSPTPVAQILRGADAMLFPDIPDELLVENSRDEDHLALLRSAGMVSAMIVPLRARGRTFGAMTMASSTPDRRFDADDLELAEEIARRCAIAVDNARLYRERSYVAQTLQRSLLPDRVPEIPGLELAVRFHAAGEGNEVGGDFYDVFATRHGGWSVVIGDVSGKGAAAAAVTALARYTVRAAWEIEDSPAAVLRFLNDAMLRHETDDRFATVLLAHVTTDDGGATVRLTSGGHPLPVLLRAGGEIEAVGAPGTLMGMVADPRLVECEVRLGPGDKLVLFTDGVTEARVPEGLLGTDGLMRVLDGAAALDAAAVGERIEQVATAGAPEDGPRDDIAIVVLQAATPSPRPGVEGAVQTTAQSAGEGLTLRIGGGPQAPARARQALDSLAARLTADALWRAQLLVTELVTNSVRHGGAAEEHGFVALEAELLADTLRVAVRDRGPGFDAVPRHAEPASPSGRGLFLVDALADRWGATDGGTCVWFEVALGAARGG